MVDMLVGWWPVLAAVSALAAAVAALVRLNALRDARVPWADALLKAFTRGAAAFAIALVVCVFALAVVGAVATK